LVIGDEKGDSGTPHFQGYLELKKKVRFAQIKTMFLPLVPHLEGRRGTSQQAADYCKKDGLFLEFGELKVTKQGKESQLELMTDMLVGKKHMREVALASPATWVRNYRGLAAFQQLIADPPRVFKEGFQLHLYYGKTGTGKTYKALLGNPGIFKKPIGKGLWFDGYQHCEPRTPVLFDECNGQYPLTDMLQITDSYICQVEVKGGHTHLDCDLVILTTNIHPSIWYQNAQGVPYGGREENGAALKRRFTKIFHFKTRHDIQEITDKAHFWECYSEYQ